jgi:hypothetical protein
MQFAETPFQASVTSFLAGFLVIAFLTMVNPSWINKYKTLLSILLISFALFILPALLFFTTTNLALERYLEHLLTSIIIIVSFTATQYLLGGILFTRRPISPQLNAWHKWQRGDATGYYELRESTMTTGHRLNRFVYWQMKHKLTTMPGIEGPNEQTILDKKRITILLNFARNTPDTVTHNAEDNADNDYLGTQGYVDRALRKLNKGDKTGFYELKEIAYEPDASGYLWKTLEQERSKLQVQRYQSQDPSIVKKIGQLTQLLASDPACLFINNQDTSL